MGVNDETLGAPRLDLVIRTGDSSRPRSSIGIQDWTDGESVSAWMRALSSCSPTCAGLIPVPSSAVLSVEPRTVSESRR